MRRRRVWVLLRRRYCRFYRGRRTADDERQIGRWTGVTGPKGRWKRTLLNKIVHANARWDDASVSPVIRQTLLHWCFEVTERDVLQHARAMGALPAGAGAGEAAAPSTKRKVK